jgi:hypothetical protein
MTWTKADLRRMQAGLDRVTPREDVGMNDEQREQANATLRDQALDIVRGYLHRLSSRRHTSIASDLAEARTADRLLARLTLEPLPIELLRVPQYELQHLASSEQERVDRFVSMGMPESARSVVLMSADRREREVEEQRTVALTKPVDVPTYQPDPERDLRAIRTNLDDLISRGVVEVHRASSEAFNTDTTWGDVIDLVSWVSFARPAAHRRNASRGFDRCTTSTDPWSLDTSMAMARLWSAACDEEKLPLVLDLRGAPESHGHLVESWQGALASALRRATRGIVIIVDGEAWPLARLLPQRVGPT